MIDVFVDRIRAADGRVVTREIVMHPGAVAIIPVLPSGELLLVRQERHAARGSLWEIPAGTLEVGEPAAACARRELIEETGHEAKTWRELITFFTTPGFSDEQITLFLASDLQRVGEHDPAEIEACQPFSPTMIRRMVEHGDLADAKTILGLLWCGVLTGPLETGRG